MTGRSSSASERIRRFPRRNLEVFPTHSVLDSDAAMNEVCLLKLHGSIDWINRGRFDDLLQHMRATSGDHGERHLREQDPVFGDNGTIATHPLLEGEQQPDDPLNRVAVVDDLDKYYADFGMSWRYPPVLLAPSHAKQLYGEPLRGFWEGLPTGGSLWGGLSVVGCSLPPADPYTKQALYRIARDFAYAREHPEEQLWPMNRIKVVNYAEGAARCRS